jgi:hypothetical protein
LLFSFLILDQALETAGCESSSWIDASAGLLRLIEHQRLCVLVPSRYNSGSPEGSNDIDKLQLSETHKAS